MQPKIQTAPLFAEFHRTRDPKLREQIITAHLDLVKKTIKPFLHKGQTEDMLYSTGCVGLILAVDRFDPTFDTQFTTFAHATITGELKKHFRDQAWDLKVPRSLKEDYLKVNRAITQLKQNLGHSPTIAEISEDTKLEAERVLEALEVAQEFSALSIQATNDDSTTSGVINEDFIKPVDDNELGILDSLDLKALLDKLPKREQLIIQMIYFHEASQQDVAIRLGLSQIHVSRLLKQALLNLQSLTQSSSPPDTRRDNS